MSKISNLILKDGQSLMDLALNELSKRMDKLEAKRWRGTFSFKFLAENPWHKGEWTDYTVAVNFENRGYMYPMGYQKGTKYRSKQIIFMNSCYMSNRQTVIDVFVHEITHISQEFNDFLTWSTNIHYDNYQKDIVAKRKKTKVSYTKYRDNCHSEHLAEHEAVLATALHQLKEGKIEIAKEYFLRRPEYFHFTWKEFVKKAYSYGVSKESIIKVREMVIDVFEKEQKVLEKNSKFEWDSLYRTLNKRTPLMIFFNMGDKYWKDLYEVGKEMVIENPNSFRNDNQFKFIEEKIEMIKGV